MDIKPDKARVDIFKRSTNFLDRFADDFEVAHQKPSPQEFLDAIANAIFTLRNWLVSDNHRRDLSEFSSIRDLENHLNDLSVAWAHYKRITDELNNPLIQQKSFSRDAPAEARARLYQTFEQTKNDILELRRQLQK